MKMEVFILLELTSEVMHSYRVSQLFPVNVVEVLLQLKNFNVLVDVLVNILCP